jgi:hypothetical protein
MKIARWEVNQGNEVSTDPSKMPNPDRIYGSFVFRRCQILSSGVEAVVGGPAVDPLAVLPPHIEHLKPYYELYGLDYSMGFTSRGCIRRCPFCDNWRREGYIRDHAPISEFWDEDHDKVVILDNNFLAAPRWRENLEFIQAHGLRVNFHQGLDIRLIDEEKANHLASIRYENFSGSGRYLHFAFDDLRIKEQVVRGVETLREAGIPPRRLYFYVLVGYWTQDIAYDLERIKILRALGCNPCVMVYERASRLQRKLARWVNGTYAWRREEFSDYRRLTTKERAVVRAVEEGG